MKWSSVLSASALVASVFASPIASKREDSNQYVLRISSETENLNGKYLSIKGDLVGFYDAGELDAAQHITVDGTDKMSLHPSPVGIIEHALGLTGSDGWLDFKDLAQPGEESTADDETYSWSSFTLGDTDTGDFALQWGSSTATPGWVAVPVADGGYKIKNFDSSKGAVVAQNYIPIKIVLDGVMTVA